jgi:hypothetical protein
MRRLLLAPLAAALLLTGCGDSGSPAATDTLTPAEAIAQVGQKTTEAGSSRFAMTTKVVAGGQDVEITGEGAFSLDGKKGQLSMTIPGAGAVEVRILDGLAYMQVPQAPGWYSISMDKLAGSSLGSSTDPTSSLQQLSAASTDLKEVGTATVRGEETTHYTGILDLEKAAASVTGPARKQLEKGLEAMTDKTAPFDAYLDSEGRMRKLTQRLEISQQGQSGTVDVTVEFFDFGVAVDVVAPPKAEVQDGTQLLGGFLGA